MTSTASIKRIQNECRMLQTKDTEGYCEIEMVEENVYHWRAHLAGSSGSLYAGYKYELDVTFSTDYPFSPPKVKFVTRIAHPNVNDKGDICLDILKPNGWNPGSSLKTVLLSIMVLLDNPNFDDPLNPSLAQLKAKDPAAYELTVKQTCAKYGIRMSQSPQ